jgi:hypothetical protein
MFTDWNFVNVRDFDYLNNYWNETIETISEDNLLEEIEKLGGLIKSHIDIPIPIIPLESEASKFYKVTYQSPARLLNKLLEV